MQRRQALETLGAIATATATSCAPATPAAPMQAGAGAASGRPGAAASPGGDAQGAATSTGRMPTLFLPHGGGPWPFMDLDAMGISAGYDEMAAYLGALGVAAPRRPDAVLMISAHWETAVPTVMTAGAPPMLYDYSGFPPETYTIEWPAPGAPRVAERALELLEGAGFASAADSVRGFDHGTFVPMMLAYPGADVPTFQLSLKRGLDPREHLSIGRALAPLRDEGVLIVGSGMSYHNMAGFFGRVPTVGDDSLAFDEWLGEACSLEADGRDTRLAEWALAPRARRCHPREEHLLPLMIVAGAAGEDAGVQPYRGVVMNAHVSAVHFG